MLFNDPVYIFIFLPLVFIGYFGLGARAPFLAKVWLILSSLFFYAYWDWRFLPLILFSLCINYVLGKMLIKTDSPKRWLTFGIIFNIGLLGWFKYANFAVDTLNMLTHADLQLFTITLPLAISFFTFQQIAFLVDCTKNKEKAEINRHLSIVDYALFVCFFPQLIAGPIVHHKEMMPQFLAVENLSPQAKNILSGLALFTLGLFKKVVLADTFAGLATPAFDTATTLTFAEAWLASLSYTCQLYFDFSGYTDMALGVALLFNIRLPQNFNAPYRALSIQDFWQRWHITLGRFLKDYVYIPLGGNKKSYPRTCVNLFTTFVIGGLWHGAAWTFVAWGALHGCALVIHRSWKMLGLRLYTPIAWFITFMFINASWVLFRAQSFPDALKIYQGMLGLNGFTLQQQFLDMFPALTYIFTPTGTLRFLADGSVMGAVEAGMLLLTAVILLFFCPKSGTLIKSPKPWVKIALNLALAVALPFSLQAILFNQTPSEFLYFRF